MEAAKLAWQAKIIPAGSRALPTSCSKVKNTPATGTREPACREASQTPFVALLAEFHQEEVPQENDAVKLAKPRPKENIKAAVRTPLGRELDQVFQEKGEVETSRHS